MERWEFFLGKGRAANALMLFPVGCVSPGKRKKTTVTEVKTAHGQGQKFSNGLPCEAEKAEAE